MKITIINGSPRKNGNSATVVEQLLLGFKEANHDIEIINANQKKVQGCIACDVCKSSHGKCTHTDDTNTVLNTLLNSDLLIFVTPVYWWGVSAQMKLIIDKFYAIQKGLKNKKYGLVSIGGNSTNDIQYELISTQFKAIAGYLSWEVLFEYAEQAHKANELKNDELILKKYFDLAKMIN